MAHRLSIRFQHWIAAFASLLVVAMTMAFLLTVFGQFRTVAEDSAQGRFSLVAEKASEALQARLQEHARRAGTLAAGHPRWFRQDGRLNTEDMVPVLLAALRTQPDVYSEYFGLATGEFLQVIGIRGNPAVRQALEAPRDAHFGVRHIRRQTGGDRIETWQFLSESGQPLGTRSAPASYDPSVRPWYQGAQSARGVYLSDPYLFSSTQRSGLTIAAPLSDGFGVYGIDISLDRLPELLANLSLSPNAYIAVLDDRLRVLASVGHGGAPDSQPPLQPLAEAQDPRLIGLAAMLAGLPATGSRLIDLEGRPHVIGLQTLSSGAGNGYRVLTLAPVTDFTATVDAARLDVLLMAGGMLLLLIPLAMLGTRRITRALVTLAADSERLKQLDFTREPQHVESFLYEVDALGQAQEVMHRSIRQRAEQLQAAQAKLSQLVDSGIQLGREKDHQKLLRQILFGGRDIAHCAAGTLFLKTETGALRFAVRTNDDALPSIELPLRDPQTGEPSHRFVATHVALTGETVVIDDVYTETRFDLSGTKQFSEDSGFRTVSMLTVPLMPRPGEIIGVLQFMNALDPVTGATIPFPHDNIRFVEALATQAAVAIENQNLLKAQEALMEAMIKLIAGSIDAKSPYTGGHCERVPELAMMLAQEACLATDGPLADFRFTTEDEWREFRVGAWLHDCGKVTSPEYVVDKATKLETIYNRIHEIRTRFEVLLRDAQIERLQAIHERGEPVPQADARFEARRAELLDDFAFVAECNIGGEFMAPERIERLERIATRTWWRHFDDRLGLSHEEGSRLAGTAPPALPALERLLADKPEHIVPRPQDKALDEKYGFRIQVPEHLYNRGEVHNLRIGRGTLTEEERFKINEHIIQTIVMLEQLPLPKNLRRVPEYAGTHHETLIGTGYPRKLAEKDLSVPARIMAIADIFEALTASDRPYKKAKTLSESVKILSFFKKDRHIDPVLFDLFLRSGVYLEYARKFLRPEQIDEVDIGAYLD